MTSRERLLRCMRHEPVDRVPISTYELVGWNPDSFENNQPSYRLLMDRIREKTDCIYMLNPGQRNVHLQPTDVQVRREGKSVYTRRIFSTPKGDLSMLQREDDDVYTVWTVEHLLKDLSDIDKYLSLPYAPSEFDMDDFYRRQKELGDKGVMMISLDDPICQAAELFEMGMFLTFALTEPDTIRSFMDAIYERQAADLDNLLRQDVRDIVFRICGPEYATPPYMNPNRYEDLVTRFLKPVCRKIRDAGGLPRIHCHGKIASVIDQFAQTDAMALDPLEPPPDGDIPLGEIKRRYGGQLCLFGNLELKELERSAPSRIDALVRQAMEEAKAGSGFVLMPTASPINVPLCPQTQDNYFQMIESAYRYGQY